MFTALEDEIARQKERLARGEEVVCLCCGNTCKVYKRHLHKTMVRQLVALYRIGATTKFVHASEIMPPGQAGMGDFSKLKYWGLIEKREHDGRQSSGYWRVTEKGKEWLRGDRKIPEHVLVYQDKALSFSNETVTVSQALGNPFNFDALFTSELDKSPEQIYKAL